MPTKNFAISTVATAPSPATSGTSLVVATGHGTRFPVVPFKASIWPTATTPTPATAEIVTVTARTTDTLTITRAQESSTARTVLVGDQIAATFTAAMYDDLALSGAFFVKAYGATGDGTTDDTAAVQAAITAAGAAGGGTVVVDRGTYVCTTLTLAANVTLRGAGLSATTIKLKNTTNANLINGSSVDRVGIADLTLDGNKANNVGAGNWTALSLGLCADVRIANIRVLDADYMGIVLAGCARATVANCRIDTPDYVGIWIGTSGATHATGTLIEHCSITSTGLDGIIVDCDDVTLRANTITGAGRLTNASGIYVGANRRNIICIANRCSGSTNYGIDYDISSTDQTYGAIVSNNVCTGNRNSGIGICSNGGSLSNNQCLNNGQTIGSAPDSDAKLGIQVDGLNITIVGGRCTDTQVSKTQEYGIGMRNASTVLDKTTIIGVDLDGNQLDGVRAIDFFARQDIVRGVRTQGERIGQHSIWTADATHDLGDATHRPRDFYLSRNLLAGGSLLSNGAAAGIGYATGAGGTVTQLTSKTTTVILNRPTGQITLFATTSIPAAASNGNISFTLTNSAIAATDIVQLSHQSGGTAGAYALNAQAAAGSATINVRNLTTGALAEAIVISFIVLKAVTA